MIKSTKKKILVLGGAGYIGSIAVRDLCNQGDEVVVIDNLSKGKIDLVDKRAKFYQVDIVSKLDLEKVFETECKNRKFDAIMHFAALKAVGESMEKPELYSNNIIGSINVLNAMVKFKIPKIIFSSTAAVYGMQEVEAVDENCPTNPINYYGFTKLEIERVMKWYSELKGISCIAFRYFNVAGDGGLNYLDPEAQNVFPIISEVLSGKREKFVVFGDDYDTRDGSGIRDYIHVLDLVSAHILALDYNCQYEIFNLGTKNGQSVFELVKEFEKVSGKKIPYIVGPRRAGDPGSLIAVSDKAKKLLGWEAKLGLKEMVESTWKVYSRTK